MNIAVIGAGFAGLACARVLSEAGHQVILFEKSRGVSGRAPTRWFDRQASTPVGVDHGTQYFSAESVNFRDLVLQAQKAGAVAPWMGRVVDLSYGELIEHPSEAARWVGSPGMNSFGAYLANGLDVRKQSKVIAITKESGSWSLTLEGAAGQHEQTVGSFDWLVCAMPAEQSAMLFKDVDAGLHSLASKVHSNVTWTVMISLPERVSVDFDGAFVYDSPIGWICRDSSKPGRAAGERWVIQATAAWSKAHANDPTESIQESLMDVFRNVTGCQVEPDLIQAHRWLYSIPQNPLKSGPYLSSSSQLAACGDWLSEGSVEAAYLSGYELGQSLTAQLAQIA